MQYATSVNIKAPLDRVWAVLTDVTKWPQWTESVTSVEHTGDLRLGSEVTLKQPRLARAIWRVTELDPGRSFVWVSKSPGVTTTAGHYLTPQGDGTVDVRFTITQSGPLAPLIALFARNLTRRYVDMEAYGLKRRCETS